MDRIKELRITYINGIPKIEIDGIKHPLNTTKRIDIHMDVEGGYITFEEEKVMVFDRR